MPGVSGMVDRLRVAPAQPMGDGAIRDHVRDALLQEPVFGNCRIRVWDKNSEKAEDMAEFNAWYVFGVDKVINALAVQE